MDLGDALNEAFGMSRPGRVHDLLPLGEDLWCSAIVNVVWGQHADAAVSMLGVVPRKERPTVTRGMLDACEAPRKAGLVFQGLELRFRERIVVADLRSAEGSRDAHIYKKLSGALARHRRATVGMKRQDFRPNALLVAGLFDQASCQCRVLPVRHHPTHGVAAENVE